MAGLRDSRGAPLPPPLGRLRERGHNDVEAVMGGRESISRWRD